MPEIAVLAANVSGDIGGTGISRIHVVKGTGDPPSATDCSTAAAAWRTMWFTLAGFIPTDTQWTWNSSATVIDSASAGLVGFVALSSVPLPVTGSNAGAYAAGNGARIDWRTATVNGRRQMRAANFLVPLGSTGFDATGRVSSGFATNASNAGQTFLASLSSAGMNLVSYHRPAKGATVGGTFGPVTSLLIPSTPATLRSRRV
jgi:hypothetical protein